MKSKSEITYWLLDWTGVEGNRQLLVTDAISVPEEGEVLSIKTKVDLDDMKTRYRHLENSRLTALFPNENDMVYGDFMVKKVKRYLETKYFSGNTNDLLGPSTTPTIFPLEIPILYYIETFEVFVEPVK